MAAAQRLNKIRLVSELLLSLLFWTCSAGADIGPKPASSTPSRASESTGEATGMLKTSSSESLEPTVAAPSAEPSVADWPETSAQESEESSAAPIGPTYFEPKEVTAPVEAQSVSLIVPKSLEECIQIALERHFPIEIAKDKAILAKRRVRKALRDLFPAMNFTFDYAIGGLSFDQPDYGSGSEGPVSTYSSGRYRFALRQPLFHGGSLMNAVRAEWAGLKSAEGEYNKVFTDLAMEVATAYFNYSRAKSIVSYREALLEKAKEAVRLSEVKAQAELISEIEHLNVQSQQTRIQSDMEQAKEQVALAELEIQKLLNLNLSERIEVYSLEYYRLAPAEEKNPLMKRDFEISKTQETAAAESTTTGKIDTKEGGEKEDKTRLDEFIGLAYEHRPEFIIQREKVKNRRFQEKSVKGSYLPKADFIIELGQLAEAFEWVTKDPKYYNELRAGFEVGWNIGGTTTRYTFDHQIGAPSVTTFLSTAGTKLTKNSISVGVLDDLELFSKAKEAEIATKEAILELELAERDVLSEVKESYYNYKRALIQVRSALKRLVYRQKLVELAKHRSEVNEIQLSEYIQAEMDLVDEQNTLYQAMNDYFLAKASLNKAVGVRDFLAVDEFDIEKPLRKPSEEGSPRAA